MKATEFVEKLKYVTTLKTTYLMGGFGCRLGLDWYNENYQWNKDHAAELRAKYNTNPITFGFDCICLIKAVLFFSFTGNQNAEFGGSKYIKDLDITTGAFKKSCGTLSTDFGENDLVPGELVFIPNHIGVYIGNGEVIECTPAWAGNVQKTLLPWRNSTNYERLPVRKWDQHGKSSYIEYEEQEKDELAEAIKERDQAIKERDAAIKERDETAKKLTETVKLKNDILDELNVAQNELKTAKTALAEAKAKLSAEEAKTKNLQAQASQDACEIENLKSAVQTQADRYFEAQRIVDKLTLDLEKAIAEAEQADKEHLTALKAAEDENTRLKEKIADLELKLNENKPGGVVDGDGQKTFLDVWRLFIKVLKRSKK